MAFDAAALIEAASTLNPALGIPYLGHSQTNATGPGGGSGQTQDSCRDWRPPPCPPSRDQADVLGGVGLLGIGRGHRDHGAAEHPALVARLRPSANSTP
jgi:hypothetical protein